MANFEIKSIDTIFQELLTEKQTLATLNGLSDEGITDENSLITQLTNGLVPEWILWLYNFAVSTNITHISMQTAIDDITSIIENQIAYTANWYITKSLEFEYGNTLTVNPITYMPYYASSNPLNRIIASCTTRDVGNKLILKVRRTNNTLLSVDELSSYNSYLSKIKPAGTQIEVQNFNPDELTLNMTILYKGNMSLSKVKSDVESVINDYLNNIEYDSYFVTSSLINKLQEITYLVDVRFNSASAINSLGVNTSFTHDYLSNAGYMKINPLTPLSTSITYIPK